MQINRHGVAGGQDQGRRLVFLFWRDFGSSKNQSNSVLSSIQAGACTNETRLAVLLYSRAGGGAVHSINNGLMHCNMIDETLSGARQATIKSTCWLDVPA
jgi:hypothetical protein